MSLRRRLLIYLVVCAPLVWGVALFVSVDRARHEVNELFDTELIRLARQVQARLSVSHPGMPAMLPPPPAPGSAGSGEADVRDLAVAVWDAQGRLMLADGEGAQFPRFAGSGFVDEFVNGNLWRVYYLRPLVGEWMVAAGQKAYERDELVFSLTASQVVPWLLVLPLLLAIMAWAVRRALVPVRLLTAELQGRRPDDLQPVREGQAPAELEPLVKAMNGLFARIETMLVRERRFTADAAHELRTPLAVLRVQWDVVRRASSELERAEAEAKFTAGLERMSRLVGQMLALSRLEATNAAASLTSEVRWPTIVEHAMHDCLVLAERRRIELACEWPPPSRHPMPLLGDEHLLTVLLRNLLDNAVRYAPRGTAVTLRIAEEHLEVENQGEPLSPEQLLRLGERFYRPAGQHEGGSGLGLSIARRIAELHGLEVTFGAGADGKGVRVVLRFDPELR